MEQPRIYEEFFDGEDVAVFWGEDFSCEEQAREAKADARKGKPSGKGKGKGAADKKSGKRNKELGRRGEEAAADFLRRRGFVILERNWTCFAGEADIVAMDGNALVFVEVKTRHGIDKGFPADAVNEKKRRKYENIALAYVQDHYVGEVAVRFDVVSVVVVRGGRALIRHHVGAFCGC